MVICNVNVESRECPKGVSMLRMQKAPKHTLIIPLFMVLIAYGALNCIPSKTLSENQNLIRNTCRKNDARKPILVKSEPHCQNMCRIMNL
jgi:hypothetical protein